MLICLMLPKLKRIGEGERGKIIRVIPESICGFWEELKQPCRERERGVVDYVGSNLQLFVRFWTLVCCDELIVSELSREDPF